MGMRWRLKRKCIVNHFIDRAKMMNESKKKRDKILVKENYVEE